MKKIILAVIALLTAVNVEAQGPMLQWAKSMGSNYFDQGQSITVDASGNVYTTGCFTYTVDFDPGPGTYNLVAPGGYRDVYIQKLDATGNFLWAKRFGGTAYHDEGKSIKVDAFGNVYTTGFFYGTTDFDPGVGTYTMTSFGSDVDVFISKLDASGNFVWAKQLGGTLEDHGNAIDVDPLGNVYVAGYFEGTGDFDPSAATYTLTALGSPGQKDMFISKLDASGNFVWADQIGGTVNDEVYSISVDASSNVFLTGYFGSTTDFDPGVGTYNLNKTGPTNGNAFLLKLDGLGAFSWVKKLGGGTGATSLNLEYGKSVTVDASGNVYLTGIFDNVSNFDPGGTNFSITSAGNGDAFITKYNNAGTFAWAKKIGVALGKEEGTSITVNASGDVYTLGQFVEINDFDPSAATYTIQGAGLTDIFVSKLNSAGNFIYARNVGAGNHDYGLACTSDASDNFYFTGQFEGAADFDPAATSYTLPYVSTGDAFVAKWSACLTTSATINATNISCNGYTNGTATVTPTGGTSFTYSWSPNFDVTATANSLSAGNYTCIITNGCGSSITKTISIIEPTALSITAIANGSVVCTGGSSTLTASGSGGTAPYTYTWVAGATNSVNVVSPTATSTYTVNMKDNSNCVKSQTISVTVSSAPAISVNSGTICSGNSFTIIPSGASTYTYSSGSAVVSPTVSTNYTVTGTTASGCVNSTGVVSYVTVGSAPAISVNSGTICSGNSFTIVPSGANTYTYSSGSAVVNPTVSANYTVTGTTASGCINSTGVVSYVTVDTAPTISVNIGTICSGESFTITPSGANTYSYSGGSAVVSPTTTTSYTVTGYSAGGCASTTDEISDVTVNPSPIITVVSSNSLSCAGDLVTLTADGANTYSWSTGSSSAASTETITPTVTTTYTVIGVDELGCSGTTTITQNVNLCTGIDNLTPHINEFIIYPNPTTGILNLTSNSINEKRSVQILNALGQVLINENVTIQHSTFNLSHLPTGMYFVNVIENNRAIKTQKIVKQ